MFNEGFGKKNSWTKLFTSFTRFEYTHFHWQILKTNFTFRSIFDSKFTFRQYLSSSTHPLGHDIEIHNLKSKIKTFISNVYFSFGQKMEADWNKYQIMNQIQLSLLKNWVIKYLFGLKVPLIRNFKFLKRPQTKIVYSRILCLEIFILDNDYEGILYLIQWLTIKVDKATQSFGRIGYLNKIVVANWLSNNC